MLRHHHLRLRQNLHVNPRKTPNAANMEWIILFKMLNLVSHSIRHLGDQIVRPRTKITIRTANYIAQCNQPTIDRECTRTVAIIVIPHSIGSTPTIRIVTMVLQMIPFIQTGLNRTEPVIRRIDHMIITDWDTEILHQVSANHKQLLNQLSIQLVVSQKVKIGKIYFWLKIKEESGKKKFVIR